MGLKHLKLELRVEPVEVSDGDIFTVRGLDLSDIIKLVESHREQLTTLFDSVAGGGVESILLDTSSVVSLVFSVAPGAAVQIIALGADEADLDLVRLLPVTAQLDALLKIGKLTFATQSPKKVLETITEVMSGATAALKMRLPT